MLAEDRYNSLKSGDGVYFTVSCGAVSYIQASCVLWAKVIIYTGLYSHGRGGRLKVNNNITFWILWQ